MTEGTEEPRRQRPARLPADLDALAVRHAAANNMSVNQLIIVALERLLRPSHLKGQGALLPEHRPAGKGRKS